MELRKVHPQDSFCPRSGGLTVHSVDGCHTWENDLWSPKNKNKDGSWWERWPHDIKPPRTCSFCGSVHPADLLELLLAGFEMEPSNKGDKWYVHPPGWRKHMDRVFGELRMNPVKSAFVEAQPLIKFYTQHATTEELARINSQLRANRGSADV